MNDYQFVHRTRRLPRKPAGATKDQRQGRIGNGDTVYQLRRRRELLHAPLRWWGNPALLDRINTVSTAHFLDLLTRATGLARQHLPRQWQILPDKRIGI